MLLMNPTLEPVTDETGDSTLFGQSRSVGDLIRNLLGVQTSDVLRRRCWTNIVAWCCHPVRSARAETVVGRGRAGCLA